MPNQKEISYQTPLQPRQLRLDTTTTCNAKCISCHRLHATRKGEMPWELISQLLADVASWPKPLTEIVPVNYGEFFARKDWYEILQAIAHKLPHTQIVIPTNAGLLTDGSLMLLTKILTLRVVNFSINAYFDETYEAFTGLKASNLAKIRRLAAELKILRPDVSIWASMVFDPEYQTDLERDYFINSWISHATPQILPAASAGRRAKRPYQPVLAPCRSIFSDIVVGFDGKISSCCFDSNFHLDLGFYQGNLLENWRGEDLTKLRRLHNDRRRAEVDLCKQCTYA